MATTIVASVFKSRDAQPETLRDEGTPCVLSGLENFGNTCFINSAVQLLRVLPHLAVCLRTHTVGVLADDGHPVTSCVMCLLSRVLDPNEAVSGDALQAFVQFVWKDPEYPRGQQADAREFMLWVLHRLGAVDSTLQEQLSGALVSRLSRDCGHQTSNEHPVFPSTVHVRIPASSTTADGCSLLTAHMTSFPPEVRCAECDDKAVSCCQLLQYSPGSTMLVCVDRFTEAHLKVLAPSQFPRAMDVDGVRIRWARTCVESNCDMSVSRPPIT